jgi:hypothetical protein
MRKERAALNFSPISRKFRLTVAVQVAHTEFRMFGHDDSGITCRCATWTDLNGNTSVYED